MIKKVFLKRVMLTSSLVPLDSYGLGFALKCIHQLMLHFAVNDIDKEEVFLQHQSSTILFVWFRDDDLQNYDITSRWSGASFQPFRCQVIYIGSPPWSWKNYDHHSSGSTQSERSSNKLFSFVARSSSLCFPVRNDPSTYDQSQSFFLFFLYSTHICQSKNTSWATRFWDT